MPAILLLAAATAVAQGGSAIDELEPLSGGGYAAPAGSSVGADDALSLEPLAAAPTRARRARTAFPGLPAPSGKRLLVEEIVARVNGRVLTRSMFVARLEARHFQITRGENPAAYRELLEDLVPDTLQDTLDTWLLLQEATDRFAQLESWWRQNLSELRREVGAKSIDELEQLLREEGMTLEILREQRISRAVVELLVESQIAHDADAIRAYYEENIDSFVQPARVDLRQILLPVNESTSIERAQDVAADLLNRLRNGEDWCELHSIYGVGGAACGAVGLIDVGDLAPELREVAAGLPIQAVSRPIVTAQGVHLVQVLARQEVAPVPFDEIAPEVERRLVDEQYYKGLDDLLVDLRRTAVVEVNPVYSTAAQEPGQ